jgi:hypothetical protein
VRRLAGVAVVVLVGLVVATAALAARGDPKKAITAADQARAKSMLLRRADLTAGFRAAPPSKESDPYCAATDESDLTETGEADSPEFTRETSTTFLFVASGASVYKTAADALTSWRRSTGAAGEACARRTLAAEIATSGLRLRTFGRASFPKLAPLTVAYRLTADIPAGSTTIRAYFDVVALQRGRAQTVLLVGSAPAAVARTETVALARTIAGRMTKAMRGG